MAPPRFVPPPPAKGPAKAWHVDVSEVPDFDARLQNPDVLAILALEHHAGTVEQVAALCEAIFRTGANSVHHDAAHLTLARLYGRVKRLNEAEMCCREVLRQNLNQPEALLLLADICQDKGQFRDAMLALNKLLQIDDRNGGAVFRLGEIYHLQGNFHESVRSYLRAADLLWASGHGAQAQEALDRAKVLTG